MSGISSKAAGSLTNKFKYNGNEEQRQEFSDGSGLELYDFNARTYDHQIGRFIQIDALSGEGGQESWNPYHSCFNNPILRNDPTGNFSPIYDQEGNLQGTDDQGLQGKAIVMDKKDFQQGMQHDEAVNKSLGVEGLKDDKAKSDLLSSYNSLPSRPDYDGFVTISEGVDWAKAHLGALNNPTPENTLYLDASKLDFGNLSVSNFKSVNSAEPQNLFNAGNVAASAGNATLRATVYALGRVDMQLMDRDKGSVKVINNSATDYDWNRGGGLMRNAFINIERTRTGLNDSNGFKTYYYGTGTLNKSGTMQVPRYEDGRIM